MCFRQEIPISLFFSGLCPFELFSQYKLPKQLVNATSLKLQNIILWNLVASKDIICKCAYWLEILISWFFQELCSIELVSLLSVQYVGACGMWACSLRFFHCLYNILVIMADMVYFQYQARWAIQAPRRLVRIQDLIKWS
jgi:hypothetical protein